MPWEIYKGVCQFSEKEAPCALAATHTLALKARPPPHLLKIVSTTAITTHLGRPSFCSSKKREANAHLAQQQCPSGVPWQTWQGLA